MSEEIFLSIDFEDFSHDLSRLLGLSDSPPVRIEALWNSYEKIQNFLNANNAKNITFFCTGILAEKAPDLISRIAKDGHEIACHYYLHDNMKHQAASSVSYFAEKAKDVLESVSGTSVIGFRAPGFSIEKNTPAQYQELAKLFSYDSSWFGESISQCKKFLHRMDKSRNLKLFPIFSARPFFGTPPLRLGGSYLKLCPTFVAQRLLTKCIGANIIPHVYLHPYEFVSDNSFALSMSELGNLGLIRRNYWRLRQHQWNTIGNSTLPAKLSSLIKGRNILGTLRDNLSKAV